MRALRTVGLISLLVAACGGQTGPTPIPNSTPVGTTAPGASFASNVEMLAAVRAASVRLEVSGQEQDPDTASPTTFEASGSGFIISSDGLVVTNEHVVAGVTDIEAFVGESLRPVKGTLVAASECTDLAVVRLLGGPFPTLKWHDGPIDVGLEVFTTGYPRGDRQFTASRGIVAKVEADHENDWSSPRHVIEHDADAAPGSSGSPLVTTDGTVVGVEYSGTDDDRHFAIDRDVARPIVEDLAEGRSAESIGIHGEGYEHGALAGIWVIAVRPGSPAAKIGIQPGDVITTLGGVSTSSGKNLHDLCSAIRRDAGAALDIRLIRRGDTVVELKGRLDGTKLTSTGRTPDLGLDGEYAEYQAMTDEDGAIELEVPRAWGDRDGQHWLGSGTLDYGPSLTAAVDIDSFWETYDSSGIFVSASPLLAREYDEQSYMDSLSYSRECVQVGTRTLKSTAAGTGWLYRWDRCDEDMRGEFAMWIRDGARSLVSVEAQLVTEADQAAFAHALDTLEVDD